MRAAKFKAALKQGLVVKVTGLGDGQGDGGDFQVGRARASSAQGADRGEREREGRRRRDGEREVKFTKRAAGKLAKLRSVKFTIRGRRRRARTVTLKR